MIEWRKEAGADTMLEDYSTSPLFDYFPAGILKGVDLEGDPVHVERTGAADSLSLLNRHGRDEFIKYGIWLRETQSHGEWTKEYELEHGHPVKQFTILMDMKGLNRRQLAFPLISVGQHISRIIQDICK